MRCPAGSAARTVETDGTPAPDDLSRTLRGTTAGATVIEASADRYAYRIDGTSVVVTAVGERVTVTATTGCS
jgi:hypothetical protein